MGIYNIVLQVPFIGYTKWDWIVFLLLAVVPTVSHVINNWLLNYVNATTISMSILGEPVGASILAFFLLGERLNAMQMIGSILVLFGVSVFLLQQQKRTAKNVVNEPVYTQEL
ncbi:Predicted permease%2C DMT superfamily [Streptococcus pneumoniae]|nr:Predicted permease%2C DMT superfamily [Streptococcus pneumoniae]